MAVKIVQCPMSNVQRPKTKPKTKDERTNHKFKVARVRVNEPHTDMDVGHWTVLSSPAVAVETIVETGIFPLSAGRAAANRLSWQTCSHVIGHFVVRFSRCGFSRVRYRGHRRAVVAGL